MQDQTVYLGSDHVVKTPDFDFQKNSLRVSTTFEDAQERAQRHVVTGIVNVFRLNLDQLTAAEDGQLLLHEFGAADVIVHDSDKGAYLSLCSEKALQSLTFMGATFTPHKLH